MNNKKIAILGAGGHGKVVADIAFCVGYQHIDFFDDAKSNTQNVIGDSASLQFALTNYDAVIVGIGDNKTRVSKQAELESLGAEIVTLIHPDSTVSNTVTLGKGSVVMAGAVINPYSKIDDSVIINTSSIVEHDCKIATGVHVSPGAALGGNVSIGKFSWVGLGANIIQGVNVGSDVVVGAGAAVISDVQSNETVVGVPARYITKSRKV